MVLTFLRKHWQPIGWVLTGGLAVNAWIQSGTAAMVVVVLAGVGCVVLVGVLGLVTGASAAHHSLEEEKAIRVIEASRAGRRELTR